MALLATDLPARKAKPDRIAERLEGLDAPWDGDAEAFLAAHGLAPTGHEAALGTPGGGNHFCEVQRVVELREGAAASVPGIDGGGLMLLVHSGSRGLGEAVLREVTARHGAAPLQDGTEAAASWLAAHDRCVRWAAANRALIARRACEALGAAADRLLDVCHNDVVAAEEGGCRCWLHRKGAAPADRGPVVIPGSRGDVSYLVEPLPGPAAEATLRSLAHGAGRKLARHEARAKLRGLHRRDELLRTRFGGRVVCGEEHLLWEEAPGAYKDVDVVVGDLVDAGLCRVLAVLEPVVTFKASSAAPRRDAAERRERSRARDAAREAKARGWR
jgi:release factor H-coupled RctB family protein